MQKMRKICDLVKVIVGMLLLNGKKVKASSVKCGGTIQKNYGNFFSPNFPEMYPNEAKCVWNITVTRGMRVTLNFSYFDIEYHSLCEYDYVEVNAVNGTIGKFCGSRQLKKNEPIDRSPPIHTPIVSPNNWLEVILSTDHSNENMERGFEGNFIGVDINECKDNNGGCDHNCFNGIGGRYCSCKIGYKLAKDGKSCKVLCRHLIELKENRVNGTIQSPEFPKEYPKDASCEYHIVAEKGFHIHLEFDEFHIEDHEQSLCPYDYLYIEDEKRKAGPYCGIEKPKKFMSISNWLIVEFFSDSSQAYKGFKARYWLEGRKCPALRAPWMGYMTGPKNFVVKETLRFSCDPSYRLEGSHERTCLANGEWTGTEPTCIRVVCEEAYMTLPENVVASDPIGGEYYVGHKLHLDCEFYHQLFGSTMIECQRNGTWSGGDTYCIKTTHCVADMPERFDRKGHLEVVLGTHYYDKEEEGTVTRKVSKVVVGQKFDYGFHSDLVLLKLSSPVTLTRFIQPICLSVGKKQKLFFRTGKPVVTVGWLHSGGRYLTDRCETVLPKSKCMEHVRKTHLALHKGVHNTEDGRAGLIPEDLMCTNATVGVPDTCKIFPGSGLVAFDKNAGKWYLGGIVSWGSKKFEHCQTYVKKYPIYTKVFKYIRWIKQNTELKNLKFPDVKDDRIR